MSRASTSSSRHHSRKTWMAGTSPAMTENSELNHRHTLDENQPALQGGSPPLQRLGVFRRGVPFAQTFHRGKFDDDDVLHRRAALGNLSGAAANQIAAAIVRDRFGRNAAIGLEGNGIAHLEFGNDVGRHLPTSRD